MPDSDMLVLDTPSLLLPLVWPIHPTLESALTTLEPLSLVAARSVMLMLTLMPRLLSFMVDTDILMDLDTTVSDMLVLDMLVLDMLDSAMLESLPPMLLSATPLHTLPTEQPTLPMLECAPTIWELRPL